MQTSRVKKGLVVGIFLLFVAINVLPSITKNVKADPIEEPTYTISGTIYYEGPSIGNLIIGYFDEYPSDQAPYLGAFIPSPVTFPATYTILGLTNGTYYVIAFLDYDGDMGPPEPDEPVGVAINNTLQQGFDPLVVNGANVNGIDVTLWQTNNPPNTPSAPTGRSELVVGQKAMYFTNTTDPDGDRVSYLFDWDAAGSHDYTWTPLFDSGPYYGRMSHSWDSPGTYVVKARASDHHGGLSDWSDGFTVTVVENHPPNAPNTPAGPARIVVNRTVVYVTSTTDPDGDRVAYMFDWDAAGAHDYSSWTGLMNSGPYYGRMLHAWTVPGTYVVKVQARDEHGALSDWSDGLTVTVRSTG